MEENLPRIPELSTDDYNVYRVNTDIAPTLLVVGRQDNEINKHLIFTVQVSLVSQLVRSFIDACNVPIIFKWKKYKKELLLKIAKLHE